MIPGTGPPVSIQLALPDGYRDHRGFRDILMTLGELGFHGVELNIRDPFTVRLDDVSGFIEDHGLALTMFASGLSARESGLSLSHPDAAVRKKTIAWCMRVFELLRGSGAGFIAGFIKGGPSDKPDESVTFFIESLSELVPGAAQCGVQLLIEATNRRESSVANSLASAAQLLRRYDPACVSILPDTYHMNMEEADMCDSLVTHAGLYRSLHISDDNRRFPGFGSIDFKRVFDTLKMTGFTGGVAIEGNAGTDMCEDIRKTAAYIASVF